MKIRVRVKDLRLGKLYSMPQYITAIEAPSSPNQNDPPNQADLRAEFYRHYRKEAEEYDKEFMKKYDEDLNTTLIFVRHRRCLGHMH